jgi:hypothetical protein
MFLALHHHDINTYRGVNVKLHTILISALTLEK